MTKDQRQVAIWDRFNQWLSLDKFWNIHLTNDGHVYPAKNESQFYFDTYKSLMFVRYTFPYVYKDKINDSFVPCEEGFLRLLVGGVEDSDIGRYHEVFSFDGISIIS